MMRANTKIALKARQQLQLSDFKGVDFSSSPLRVQPNRASGMSNFINEYGVNRKRNGWNELFRIEVDSTPQRINGIFHYVNRYRQEMLIHAGKRFYRIIENNGLYTPQDITLSSTYEAAKCDINLLKDQRSQGFFNRGKMYIIGCGDYLVYGSWNGGETYELRRVVDNEDTYIPTTTISIDDDSVAEDTRANLDDVNYLSSSRINQLVGTRSESATWTVDTGKIDVNTTVKIVLETMNGETPITKNITNNGSDKTVLYDGTTAVGTIDFEKGKISLSIATTPQTENRDNMFVTFKHRTEGYAERIMNCNFGILFGVNGNTDRLFLSGNADYPNIDFHSEMDDYTYFGDLNTASMGSDSVAINGYARLSDSTLVIYKEEAGQEASIFYRTGKFQESYDNLGNLESIRGIFPTTAGSIGEGVVSRHACMNFAGDNIILSRNGVFGIVLADNVATTERYTRERSRSINEVLKTHKDLSEAVATVYKNRYYLSIDGVCYIADSRFKYVREDDVDGSYNYEWWYWENIPARVWATIDNELYFGTADGQVCVFDEEYTDRTYQNTRAGDLSLDIFNNKILYNANVEVSLTENDIIKFYSNDIYALYLDDFTVKNNRIIVSSEAVGNILEGTEVYADNISGDSLSVNKRYFIGEVDYGDCSFALVDEMGVEVMLDDSFRLSKLISGKDLYIENILNNSFQLKETKGNSILTLTRYNEKAPTNVLAKVSHKENVVAKWYTPIFDLGTNESSKTLLKMTISTEAKVNGKLSFGYETKNADKLINAKGLNVFSFENFSFEEFSFDTGFANSYSIKVKERNFNFIMFRFISDNDCDCAINNFTIIYKINKQNKGVE